MVDIDPKKVIKNRASLELSEIKIGGKKSTDQKNTKKNISNLFDLR